MRSLALEMDSSSSLVEAAVLLPVYRDGDGELRLVLVQRGSGGVHGGELAFPGGKRDPDDNSLLDTALRETQEEIGLAKDAVSVLSRLPVVETRTTGFRITPFLARIAPPARWRPERREVAEVLDVSLSEFERPGNRGEAFMRLPGWTEPQEFPFFRIGAHKLWGASYRMLQPLLPSLAANEWDV